MAEEGTLVLTDEKGEEYKFQLIEVIQVDDDEYAVLLPVDVSNGEAVVLKIDQDEDGEEVLYEIDDDEEWEKVNRVWEEINKPEGKNGESKKNKDW